MKLYAVQDYLTASRVLLQDEIMPYRYDDESLVTALNMAWYEASRIRPDLIIEAKYRTRFSRKTSLNEDSTPTFDVGHPSVAVPVPPPYKLPFVNFMVGEVQFRDTEDTQDTRAAGFLALFTKALTSPGG